MAAILGASIEDIEHFIALVDSSNGIVEIANDNAPGQVVVSGNVEALKILIQLAKTGNKKNHSTICQRSIPLFIDGTSC